jgi:hypothetical protein
VEFSGAVQSAGGRCPELTLRIGSWTVVTDKSTRFKHVSCSDVAKIGTAVQVKGVTDSSSVVHATEIDRRKGGSNAVDSVAPFD